MIMSFIMSNAQSAASPTLPSAGFPVKSERAKLRRTVLAALRTLSTALHSEISTWSVGRQVYDGEHYEDTVTRERAPGVRYAQSWRWRTWIEYPENNAVKIMNSAKRLRRAAQELNDLAAQLDRMAVNAVQAATARQFPSDID